MERMKPWLPMAVVGIVAVLVASACSPGGDKAGGAGAPVVLRMGNTASGLDYSPAVAAFVSRVDELSGGEISLELVNEFGHFAPDAQSQVIAAVADGTLDLGFTGTNAMALAGVHSFEALDAPMLIDSYPLEKSVVTSDLAAKMMSGLDAGGIAGLALLGDAMHKPVAVEKPLLSPSDFDGIGFGMYPSKVQEAAITSLGATPVIAFGPTRDAALARGDIQGFELTLPAYQINGTVTHAPYITANVNLWPQFDIVFANPQRLASLNDEQRGWLEEAATYASVRSADLSNNDAALVRTICDSGARFGDASGGDVQAFRDAFGGVYTSLEQDPATAAFIHRIEGLKASTPEAPLEIPSGCTGPAPVGQTSGAPVGQTSGGTTSDAAALNGTYRWTISKQETIDAGLANTSAFDLTFPLTFTMELQDGTWTLTYIEGDGTRTIEAAREPFSIDGRTITFSQQGQDTVVFTFSMDAPGNIHLEPVLPMGADVQFVIAGHDWTKIEGPTPATAPSIDLAGTYRYTVTKQDAIENGPTGEDPADYPLVVTVTLDADGTWHGGEDSGTYAVSGDRIAFDWPRVSSVLTFTFTADDAGDIELSPVLPMDQGDQLIWSSEVWTKIA